LFLSKDTAQAQYLKALLFVNSLAGAGHAFGAQKLEGGHGRALGSGLEAQGRLQAKVGQLD
jgi:hypothetical protein